MHPECVFKINYAQKPHHWAHNKGGITRYTHSIQQYIFQHRTVFITFMDNFVNFTVFYFFSLFQVHVSFSLFPFKKAPYFNNDPVSATFLVRSESQPPYASIRILCYQSATAVLKICPRKWLLRFYKFKNAIETSIKRSRKASSKCYDSPLNLTSVLVFQNIQEYI